MFPEEFVKRISQQSYIDPVSLLGALKDPSPVSIRINTGKWTGKPAMSEPVPWCSSGYYLGSRPSFTSDPLFHAGCYYPQEASGMFAEEVLRQIVHSEDDIRVLDLCAAPGGKSTHLSTLIGKNGVLVSNEVIRQRASVLSENISKWGEGNSVVTSSDPSSFRSLSEYFDVVLVDAPCSGEGMFRDPVAVKEWSPQNAAHCAERQKRILTDVWPSLKENGILIYSTCTFNPAENEENILWLSGKTGALPVELDISRFKGITVIRHGGITGYGFHPGKVKGEGLFIAVLRKQGSPGGKKEFIQKEKAARLSNEEFYMAAGVADTTPERLSLINDNIVLLPFQSGEFKYVSGHLRVIKPGTDLLRIKGKGYTPAHDLAHFIRMKPDAYPPIELDYARALAYLRRDNIAGLNPPVGWILITYKGARLGFAKNIGSRINNYFPVERRIRMTAGPGGEPAIIRWEHKS